VDPHVLAAVISDHVDVTGFDLYRTGVPETHEVEVVLFDRLAVAVEGAVTEKYHISGKSHYSFEVENLIDLSNPLTDLESIL
jgi:hypothetical protein